MTTQVKGEEVARQYGRCSSRATRNLRSAGWDAAKFTARTADKAAVGLFRWATTDHSGMRKAFDNMPSMGFIDTVFPGRLKILPRKRLLVSCLAF